MHETHPLEYAFTENTSIPLNEGEYATDCEVILIPVPWTPADGLCLVDLDMLEMRVPPTHDAMPPLRATFHGQELLFLAQRFSENDIAFWEETDDCLAIDQASFCVTPLDVEELNPGWPEDVSPDQGWQEDVPWELPAEIVPSKLLGFRDPQSRYALAGRCAPTVTFEALVAELNLPARLLSTDVRFYNGCGFGDVRLLEIEGNDYHFYLDELARIGLPDPKFLVRIKYVYHYVESVSDAEWAGMLAIMGKLAEHTNGIVYQFEGNALLAVDFA